MKEDVFKYSSAPWTPFQDRKVLDSLAGMSHGELEKHNNPDLKIKIVPNPGAIGIADMFARILASDRENKRFVFIGGNPNPGTYLPLAALINQFKVNCRNVFVFTMDEWANEDGVIAPTTFQSGFTYSFLKYFYQQIDPELRMPLSNIYYPTNKNIDSYSDLIDEIGGGGADAIYSGPGWAGHIAFIDPCPELIPGYCDGGTYEIKDLNDPYFQEKAQVLTLHPLTIAQNSLHGVFGCSGNVGNVPPMAATIGPRDVMHARFKMEIHSLTTMGSFSSWQRMTSRLITHGPVTPYVPGSIYQLLGCTLYLSPEIAEKIECQETVGY